jgi:hypothetical protein
MKAIVTKYHGPTNFKGSRITATDEDGNRITISYPHELSGEDVHRAAAQALCDKMKWTGQLVGGSLKNGYVFVFGRPDVAPMGCDLCGHETVDVQKRRNGYKLCDICYWD